MNKFENIKSVVIDYGSTIDTGGRHWANLLWEAYQRVGFPVTREQFYEAYTFGEGALVKAPIVKPADDYSAMLRKKVEQQIAWLEFKGTLRISGLQHQSFIYDIANYCDTYVRDVLQRVRPVLKALSEKYRLVLVCNFYGNLKTVLSTYELDSYFAEVVESNLVGVRKPDPEFFQHALAAARCEAAEAVVVADNYQKDIVPSKSLGCKTIWFKGESWKTEEFDETLPDAVVTDIQQLLELL